MAREDITRSNNSMEKQNRRNVKGNYFDYSFLFVIIFLICFGLLMLYSASSYSAQLAGLGSTYYLEKQIISTAIGIVAMIFCTVIDYRFWQKHVKLIYYASIVSVFLVLTPIGMELNGARRWINVGIGSIQPAEFVKLAVIITTAHVVSQHPDMLKRFAGLIKVFIYAAICAGLVAIVTSNLSTAIIVIGIAVVVLFVASPHYKYFFMIGGIGAVAVGAFLLLGDAFRLSRIAVWFNPEAYASEGGYQVLQGLYAIGSGGVFGKGLGQSVQKLGFIPEAQNDYIFTIICEELGLVGAIAVIVLFLFAIRRMVVISSNAPDLFGALLVIGVMAQIAIQVILNIAVVTNSIPNTGVTLPFISYGGTSVLFLMAEVGMVLSVSRRIKRLK